MTRHEKVTPHHFDHIGLYYISLAIRYPQHKAETPARQPDVSLADLGRGREIHMTQYTAFVAKHPLPLTPEMQDLLERRTMPFLNQAGMTKPLPVLLQEAYLQGMKDAVEAFRTKE